MIVTAVNSTNIFPRFPDYQKVQQDDARYGKPVKDLAQAVRLIVDAA